jgi:hypothetical protein
MKLRTIYLFFFFSLCKLNGNSQCYVISTIDYDLESNIGNEVSLTDDIFSDKIPIGFNFCFYGVTYDSLVIGSNGIVSFRLSYALKYCARPTNTVPLPNPFGSVAPSFCIMFPWQDLDPSLGGNINYSTSGISPNRIFTVSFDSIPMDSCSNIFTGKVKLYETSNFIETHIETKQVCLNWNQGRAAHGLNGPAVYANPLVFYGEFIPGRNYPDLVWETENEGVRFSPICEVCSSLTIKPTVNEIDFKVYPNPSSSAITFQSSNYFKDDFFLTVYNQQGKMIINFVLINNTSHPSKTFLN